MKKTIAATVLLTLSLVGCGGKDPSVDQQRLDKVHEKAPSWTSNHTDVQIVKVMDEVCADQYSSGPSQENVTPADYMYLVGLALGSCDAKK